MLLPKGLRHYRTGGILGTDEHHARGTDLRSHWQEISKCTEGEVQIGAPAIGLGAISCDDPYFGQQLQVMGE